MHSKSILRLAPILAAALAASLPTPVHATKFLPLNTPATTERLPGKLVWADLFTGDPGAAEKFYTGLLGWTAVSVSQKGRGYVVFSNELRPVAGLVPRSAKGANRPSRWIGYYSVADIKATVALLTAAGAKVHAPVRNFPNRGYQAIAEDPDGIPIGLLQSSSGDAPDAEPQPGDWNWFELYVHNPKAAADFYHATLAFDVAPETNANRKSEFVLSSAGQPRGGIAPAPDAEDSKPSWLAVIRVTDLDRTLSKVPGLGGEVLVKPHSAEFGSRFAIILDSTGGTVGLVQYMENANPANNP